MRKLGNKRKRIQAKKEKRIAKQKEMERVKEANLAARRREIEMANVEKQKAEQQKMKNIKKAKQTAKQQNTRQTNTPIEYNKWQREHPDEKINSDNYAGFGMGPGGGKYRLHTGMHTCPNCGDKSDYGMVVPVDMTCGQCTPEETLEEQMETESKHMDEWMEKYKDVVTYFRHYTHDEVASMKAEIRKMGMDMPYLNLAEIPCCTSKNPCDIHVKNAGLPDPMLERSKDQIVFVDRLGNQYCGNGLLDNRDSGCVASEHKWDEVDCGRGSARNVATSCFTCSFQCVKCGLKYDLNHVALKERPGLGADLDVSRVRWREEPIDGGLVKVAYIVRFDNDSLPGRYGQKISVPSDATPLPPTNR